jgi:transposase
VEVDPTRMCELLVGLPAVRVLGIVDEVDGPLWIHIETRGGRPVCGTCGGAVAIKDRPLFTLVDLPAFGRPARLVWRKHRWSGVSSACAVGSWTEEALSIAAARLVMTDRAGRWVTEQVGRWGRTVNEVAVELGCDWHTVNDTVVAFGTALVDDDPDRIGTVTALGLDETLFVHHGPWRRQLWSTSIVDVRAGRLLDIVPGRRAAEPCAWLADRGQDWLDGIAFATLDLSGPYRAVFDTLLPDAVQVADPFHLVKVANTALDECRRRVQDDTLGHRGRKDDPLYRCRRLLTRADERLDEKGRIKLLGLLRAGDPRGGVTTAWHAKEAVRASTPTPIRPWPLSGSPVWAMTSRTPTAHRRSAGSAARSSAGATRSPPGIGLM